MGLGAGWFRGFCFRPRGGSGSRRRPFPGADVLHEPGHAIFHRFLFLRILRGDGRWSWRRLGPGIERPGISPDGALRFRPVFTLFDADAHATEHVGQIHRSLLGLVLRRTLRFGLLQPLGVDECPGPRGVLNGRGKRLGLLQLPASVLFGEHSALQPKFGPLGSQFLAFLI